MRERHGELSGGVGKGGAQSGKKRGSYNKGGAALAPLAPVSPLFTPENTGRLLRIPFALVAVKTGLAGWELQEPEEKELVASAVPCANEFVTVSPKWVALSMFSMSLLGVVFSKVLGHLAYLRELELRKQEAAKSRPPEVKKEPEPAVPFAKTTEVPPS